MKQDRVYFSTKYSIDHIAPLMDSATVDIQVQALEGPSITMVLHTSTDHRCNLKDGWTDFAVNNSMRLLTMHFHFYKKSICKQP
ncbi:Os08g0122800 [Oryza sativa Japonica Group]|uniref:Os08g0122800 protein n=1 Tax=Oryza sativa subsp. japonica TaxID=39947 RepID=A0A0P0XBC8_ORYSJ|nr:Os08g0122800 [Oryza sativa Japonica Group]